VRDLSACVFKSSRLGRGLPDGLAGIASTARRHPAVPSRPAAGRSLELGDQPVGTTGAGISPSQTFGAAGCGSPMTLPSMSALKSARRMRTRRPTCSAGSDPWSFHYLDFRVMRTRAPRAVLARGIWGSQVQIIRGFQEG
jgi:hypothetical protein